MAHLSQSSRNSIFIFPETAILRNATDLRDELLRQLNSGTSLTLDCDALVEADLSLVQLIVALRKSAADRDVTVALKQPASGALLQLLVRSGFVTAPAGAPDIDDAFWLKGTGHHE